MSVLRIRTIPDAVLKEHSENIDLSYRELDRLVSDMLETMYAHARCVGMAAPQAGILLRMIVTDASVNHKKCENHGRLVLINPVVECATESAVGREGCLSVPEFTANVARYQRVRVRAFNERREPVIIDSSGFEAVVLQHEIDHLDGVLFLDRVVSLKTDVFRRAAVSRRACE